jgi:hypothetical protein
MVPVAVSVVDPTVPVVLVIPTVKVSVDSAMGPLLLLLLL